LGSTPHAELEALMLSLSKHERRDRN
jgi:hypothetical protein